LNEKNLREENCYVAYVEGNEADDWDTGDILDLDDEEDWGLDMEDNPCDVEFELGADLFGDSVIDYNATYSIGGRNYDAYQMINIVSVYLENGGPSTASL
jgi:hypothetical protein